MHTVPMLEDGDLVIHDSHVILTYLTEKYGKTEPWYPKDLKQRALVDQKLYFEALVFNRMRAITMAPKFYSDELSPPCRAVMMACEALKIPVEYIDTKLLNKEHMSEEYLKKNPMHTVPMLEDGDLVIHDSHVILTYLTEKYGKTEPWYPKDLKQRALVDQKLYFEALVFNRMRAITYSAIFEGVRVPSEKVINELVQTFEFLEQFLSRTKFVAANHMTIADISLTGTFSAINDIVPVDVNKFPKTVAWMKEMQKQSFYQSKNVEGKEKLKALLKNFLDIMN